MLCCVLEQFGRTATAASLISLLTGCTIVHAQGVPLRLRTRLHMLVVSVTNLARRTLDFALYRPDHPHQFLRHLLAYTLTVFLQSMPRLLFFSLFVLVGLLFKGGIYFVGKLADSKDGCIRYITCFIDLLPGWCEAIARLV